MSSEETIFDKILAKKLPAKIVFEDDSVLAFSDIHPVAPVHVLVIPKKKIASFADLHELDAKSCAEFFQGISKVAAFLGLEKRGYRVVFNHGPDAQQSVAYMHAHIIAGRSLSWPPG